MDANKIISDLNSLREKSPLVHNITNFVVMNNTANALLALGASPVMAHSREEVRDMVKIASSLVLNMGTLNAPWVESMLIAGESALEMSIPSVFDPVGAGATPYRTETASFLFERCKPAILRGNASEILSLANKEGGTKGVDSMAQSGDALSAAKTLAGQSGGVVIVSGAEDFITDGSRVVTVSNGSPLMGKVTGMGCTATAIAGAFAAVNPDPLMASISAMVVMGVAGELAAEKSSGPGTMQLHFLDCLYNLTGEDILSRVRINSGI